MAEDEKKESGEGGEDQAGAGEAEAAGKGKSLKGPLIIAGALVIYTTILFGLMFVMGWGPGGTASAGGAASGGDAPAAPEVDLSSFEAPLILKLKEITVYPKSVKGRGPNRITCQIDIVLSKALADKFAEQGEKDNPLMKLMTMNVRAFLRQLLEEYGVALADPDAKERFQREAKLRLNLLKVDGDPEMQRYLRILRGHVLQVIINELEQSNY